MGLILIIILVLLLLGALPTWGHSRSWGYFPSGGLGLILVIIIVLVLLGQDLAPPDAVHRPSRLGQIAKRLRAGDFRRRRLNRHRRQLGGMHGGARRRGSPGTRCRPSRGSRRSSAGRRATWSSGTTGSPIPRPASISPPMFFPKGDATAQQLQTAAIFAAGFIARPAGAWLMGVYADRAGRRAALTLSVALMSLGPSPSPSCRPSPRSACWRSSACWPRAWCRGCRWAANTAPAPPTCRRWPARRRRGFWSSFQYTSLIGGQVVALFVLVVLQHVLSKADLAAWGWRIPFAIGGLLAIVVFWIRTGLEETRAYLARPLDRQARPHRRPAATAPARVRHRPGADRRGLLGLLRLHDLHAEVPGQHGRLLQGHRHGDHGRASCSSICCSSRWSAGSPTTSAARR